jgi:hypothetical protein
MSAPVVTSSVLETSWSNISSNVISPDTSWAEVVRGKRRTSSSIWNSNTAEGEPLYAHSVYQTQSSNTEFYNNTCLAVAL